MYNPATLPGKHVVADTGQQVAQQLAAGDGERVGAATGADVAADGAAAKNDGVVAKAGDQITVDGAAGHVEGVVVQLHVDAANTSAREDCKVPVFEEIDDPSLRHEKGIKTVALSQRLDSPAGHAKVIDSRCLDLGA
ncbi:hypothetical protein D3C81_1462450 [compost metagenome]